MSVPDKYLIMIILDIFLYDSRFGKSDNFSYFLSPIITSYINFAQ